jgi:hypothetical protein
MNKSGSICPLRMGLHMSEGCRDTLQLIRWFQVGLMVEKRPSHCGGIHLDQGFERDAL